MFVNGVARLLSVRDLDSESRTENFVIGLDLGLPSKDPASFGVLSKGNFIADKEMLFDVLSKSFDVHS